MAIGGVVATTLDHVALRVPDRDACAAELLERFDVHVIERTDRFTLIGAHASFGKLTLLDAEDDRAPLPSRIVSLVLADSSGSSSAPAVLGNGLIITFADPSEFEEGGTTAAASIPRHALVGMSLRAADPPLAAAQLEALHGMHVDAVSPKHAVLGVGDGAPDGRITLSRERWDDAAGPSMLDHIGIRVDDAEQWRERAEESDADVVRWVEAPHSKAVFVAGPEGLLIEFVEQTVPFDEA